MELIIDMSILQSHLMYAIIIMLSTFLVWIADHSICLECVFNGVVRTHKISIARVTLYTVVFLIIIIPLVSRTCGADTEVYYFDYEHDRIYKTDYLFSYVLTILHSLIDSPQIGLGIISVVTVGLSLVSIFSIRDHISVPLAFFAYITSVYYYSYNYMRMLFAISFVFVGYSLCIVKKKKTAIIPFVIAAFFHLSSIVALLIHIGLLFFKRHKKLIIALSMVGLVVFIAFPSRLLSLVSVERYSDYINSGSSMTLGLGTVLRVLPALYIIWIYRKEHRTDFQYTWILGFMLANIVFSFLGYIVASASRLSNVLLVFHTVFGIPYLVKQDKSILRKADMTCLFACYCAFIYVLVSANFETMGIVPYY